MKSLSFRVHVSPPVLLTLVLTTLLLAAAYSIAPESMRPVLLILGALMAALVAFTSVELTLYLLILSTLLSPELQLGTAAAAEGSGNTTASRGVTLRLDDLLLSVICLTWLFRMAIHKDLGAVRITPINQPIAWYILATLLATLVGFYAGRVSGYGFFFVLKYVEYFVLFYMVINQIHDTPAIHRYISVMVFTCFVVCLLGIAQIPGGERVSAPFEGELGEPNSFGGYLVLMFGVVMGMFLYEVDNAKRIRWAVMLVLIITPLAFTESRSSYLAFATMMVMFITLSEHKRLLIVGALAGLIMAPLVTPQNVIDRVMFTFEQPEEAGQIILAGAAIDTSTSDRIGQWIRVLTIEFPQHPLLGVGVTGGRFMDAQYPRVLSETGIIGLILFMWFLRRMWLLLKMCHKGLSDNRLRGLALGVQCGLAGLTIHALGANTFTIVRVMEPLMILVGLMTAALLIQQHQEALKHGEPDEALAEARA